MYEYIYKEAQPGHPIFILLHGTGGDEQNLLPVAEVLDTEAGVLSIRGNVSENGMNRFFKRHGEGNYDVEDLMRRGQELYEFIEEKAEEHDFSLEDAIYFGFSNGSNIAINMMLLDESKVNKAMLYAPMYPIDIEETVGLPEAKVFLSMGENDPIVPRAESDRVINIFKDLNADVTEFWVNSHELNGDNLLAGKQWLERLRQ
ncbi:MAG TPA: alpha/beta hydrolase [Atopostipes sp.]|nr:alpha/beta hydrolase [Atopostipes sp.]